MAGWPNGKASDYDQVWYQEILGSTPRLVNLLKKFFIDLFGVHFCGCGPD
ncbi:hypothetical protein CGRA01v4_14061 [Colletotrichum graminicola]|nr:hypothetical protein CGRA01v4_14061 [Colletotrichum graminicola]